MLIVVRLGNALGDQVRQIMLACLGEMHFVAHPRRRVLPRVSRLEVVGGGDALRCLGMLFGLAPVQLRAGPRMILNPDSASANSAAEAGPCNFRVILSSF
jgi:hypothetical protein